MQTPARVVSFTQMKHGSKEDYELLEEYEAAYCRELPERLLASLRALANSLGGYQVSRLEHSLQSATRAHAAGENEELIVAALLHDMGDELAPHSHSELAAAVLRPFVSPKTYWIIKHHGEFQMYYYAHLLGGDRNARDRFAGHPWFDEAARFCEDYDQNCFDPAFESKPLEFFEPYLRSVFARQPWGEHTQEKS
jgi:predicted HD phosphohydrolase